MKYEEHYDIVSDNWKVLRLKVVYVSVSKNTPFWIKCSLF